MMKVKVRRRYPSLVRKLTPREKFEEFDRDNPNVYLSFVEKAFHAKRFRKWYSAHTIMEVIRWSFIETTDDDYKINNNWAPFYVRKILLNHPQFEGFFAMRNAIANEMLKTLRRLPPPSGFDWGTEAKGF